MKRTLLLGIALLAYLAAVGLLRPPTAPGPPRDFEAYYAAGATWNDGANPYGQAIWNVERSIPGVDARRFALLPFVNPPVLLAALSPYARLPFGIAARAWSATLAIALLAAVGALLAIVGRIRSGWAWAGAVLTALAFGPISSDFALGQFALIGVAAAAVASLGFARAKPATAAIATLVAGLQPTFAPMLLAWSRNRRNLLAQAAGLAAFLTLWWWLARAGNVPGIGSYLRLLRAHGAAEGWALDQFTPGAIAHGFGASDAIANGVQWVVSALALATAGAIARSRRSDPFAVFCAFCALTPLAFPFFHEHDFALLFIPAILALTRDDGSGHRIYATIALLLVGVDWLGIAQRPESAVQTLLMALGLTAAALGFAAIYRARAFVPFLIAAGSILAIGALANGHAVPVWPDAMGPIAIATDASVAQAWHAEQVAAGMFAIDPFAAGLRLLPLAGAVLLVWLSARSRQVVPDSRRPSSARVAVH